MNLVQFFSALRVDREQRAADTVTPPAASAPPPTLPDPAVLIRLVNEIRPRDPGNTQDVLTKLGTLALHLKHAQGDAILLRDYLLDLLAASRHRHLFTDTGILSSQGFFSSLRERLAHKLLPAEREPDNLRDLLGEVFWHARDYEWLAVVPDAVWGELLEGLRLHERADHPVHRQLLREQTESIRVLSYRLAALGLDPELTRLDPALERHASPFIAQNVEMQQVLAAAERALADGVFDEDLSDQHMLVLLDQCMEALERVRRLAKGRGASISLTYKIVRGTQIIDRLCALLALINPVRANIRRTVALDLLRALVREENRKTSLSDVLTGSTDLLARKVTEHASHTGEHYAASTRREYFSMARSAAGAGVIVGFMALIKIFMGKLALAPLWQAIAYSLNYSLGFMLVHVLHFTIATKQPAMTAAMIAATVEQSAEESGRKQRASLDALVEIFAVVMRTQLVAILGNVLLAIPVSFAIAFALLHWHGISPASPEKAAHLLHDINPFTSLALFHAAIAGVCLFLAGLISGYYDNRASYNRIPERISQLRWLRALLGKSLAARVGNYVGNNLGGLAGNFFFGIMLGSMGTLGFILGLPIDIRHVTFSAANLAYGLVGLDFQVPVTTVLISILGVALVGITNLAVSFSLALYVALKSRQVRFDRSGELVRLLWARFRARPRDFFLPPKDAAVATPAPESVAAEARK